MFVELVSLNTVPYRARHKADFSGDRFQLEQILGECLDHLQAIPIDEGETIRFNPIENRYELAALLQQDLEFYLLIYWSMAEQETIAVTFDLDSPTPIEIPIVDQFFSVAQAYFPRLRLVYNHLDRPKVKVQNSQAKSDWPKNYQWLTDHRHQYRGRWVALHQGKLIADGSSLQDLIPKLESPENLLLTAVY